MAENRNRGPWLVALLLAAALAGCATPARMDQMVVSATDASAVRVPEPMRGSLAIRDVTGGKETNPMWMSSVGSSEFERALEASLKAVGLLSANRQSGRYQVVAHLEKLDQPMFGFDTTVTATVAYTVFERTTGKDVFRQTITAAYTAKLGDAFIGVERLKLANEGAMRANIRSFIDALLRANLARLPGSAAAG